MAQGVTVVKDLWPKIRANLSLAKGSHAAVGFPSEKDKPHPNGHGMTVAQVATANEIGSAPGDKFYRPPRPFMEQTVTRYTPKFKESQRGLMKMISAGEMSTKVALDRLGNVGKSAVQDTIRNGEFAALHPGTVARKRSSIPLIDSGHMRGQVTWVVRMKGAK